MQQYTQNSQKKPVRTYKIRQKFICQQHYKCKQMAIMLEWPSQVLIQLKSFDKIWNLDWAIL